MRKFKVVLSVLPVFCLLISIFVSPAEAQISKGNQILINRGLQLQGLSQDDCYLHLDTYSNLNYTAIDWDNGAGAHSSRPEWMGDAPGFPWARWASDETQMPPQLVPTGGDEAPYMSQLIGLQLADEWNLNDDATRTRLVNWFRSVKTNYPNVVLYHNSYGSQVGDSQLFDFYTRAQPDMLCFDTYPWQSVWDGTLPNHTGDAIPGPPTGWYGDLRRYREHARGAGIPLALYRQTFHAVQDYDNHIFRDPSFSELRLMTFAGMAFNVKYFTDFIYNTGAGSLFEKTFNGSGDTLTNSNGLYTEMIDVNKRAINLGKALTSLMPISTEAVQGYTTSILFILGRDPNGATNSVPVGFLPDPQDARYTDWAYQRNDPYLTNNWTVANQGAKNNGQPGDVIVSWFKPLDEAFDGPTFTNELYMMVVNGLTDPSGSATDCLQEITLNFSSSVTALDMLNPLTGLVQTQPLRLTNGLRQLVLDLNGGDGVLFKFSDGAPFVGLGQPIIATQPSSVTNNSGTTATLGTRAGGSSPLSYQWRSNGTNIPGATIFTYARTNVQVADGAAYSVVVSNSFGSITSSLATLTVFLGPQITAQPASQTVSSGSNVLFTVVATGNPSPAYQWRLNGANILGATASSYTRTNAQSSDAGNYSVTVSNAVGSVTSSVVALTVNGPPSITTQPQTQAVIIGGNASFNVAAVGAGPLTYQWQKDGAAISAATASALSINNVQSANLGTYVVSVSNSYGGTFSVPAGLLLATTPTIQTQPQGRTVNAGTTALFTVSASGNGLGYQWRRYGTNLADGGNIFGSTTDTLAVTAVTRFDATNYIVVITNAAGSVTSSPATLTVVFAYPLTEPFNYASGSALAGQVSPDFMTWADVGTSSAGPVVTNGTGSLTVPGLAPSTGNSVRFGGAGKSARLSFLNGKNATSGTIYFSFTLNVQDLTGAAATTGGFIAGFNNSVGTQANQPSVIAPRVYIRTTSGGYNFGVSKNIDNTTTWDSGIYTNNQTIFLVGSYTFNTTTDNTDDVCKLWINPDPSTFGAASAPAATISATVGTDITANSIASFVLFQRSGTPEPAVMIADELRFDTAWAGVTPPPAPVIQAGPASRTNNPGTTATFSVTASGNNVSYQWVRNGVPLANGGNISGATSPTLTVSSLTSGEAGAFEVIVSTAGGSTVSAEAFLTISAAPQVTAQPQSQTVNVGGAAGFSVTVSGARPLTYQWRFNATNISGATASSYGLGNVQRTNAGNYSVVITNTAGSIASSNALLTINPITPVKMSAITPLSGGRLQFSVSGDPGQFVVQASSNLVNWVDVTNIMSANGSFDFTDSVTNTSQRFYRARLYP